MAENRLWDFRRETAVRLVRDGRGIPQKKRQIYIFVYFSYLPDILYYVTPHMYIFPIRRIGKSIIVSSIGHSESCSSFYKLDTLKSQKCL